MYDPYGRPMPNMSNSRQMMDALFGNQRPPFPAGGYGRKYEIEYVSGKQGAADKPMAGNSTALFMDESGDKVWFVETDEIGHKTTVKAYPIGEPLPDEDAPPQSNDVLSSLEQRISRMEEFIYGSFAEANGKAAGGAASTASTAAAFPGTISGTVLDASFNGKG